MMFLNSTLFYVVKICDFIKFISTIMVILNSEKSLFGFCVFVFYTVYVLT